VPSRGPVYCEAKEFCASIVDSPAYQRNLRGRANDGRLSPAIEAVLLLQNDYRDVDRDGQRISSIRFKSASIRALVDGSI